MVVWVVLLVGIERARFDFKGEAERGQEGGCVVLCCIVLCYRTMVMLKRGGVLVVVRAMMLMLRW
jgi:hypothetical protein